MNGVLEVRRALAAVPLKAVLGRIESVEGRRRGPDRFAPRPIDLDLLLHGDSVSRIPPLPHTVEKPGSLRFARSAAIEITRARS